MREQLLTNKEYQALISHEPITIKGDWQSKLVQINNVPLSSQYSQSIQNHSPDGFNWGYGGSGPAQLALAIMLHLLKDLEHGERLAQVLYQRFKWDYIATWPSNNIRITIEDIGVWFKERLVRYK